MLLFLVFNWYSLSYKPNKKAHSAVLLFFDIFVHLKIACKVKQFKNLSTKDLIKKEKTLRLLNSVLIGMLLVLLAISIYNATQGRSGATIAVPIALFAAVFVNIRNAKAMKAEIVSRNNQNNIEDLG